MRQSTAGKTVLCTLVVYFFLNCISSNVFAFDALNSASNTQGESVSPVKIFERFEDILKSQDGNMTMDDIESMIVEISCLHEELYASLFSPGGERILDNDDECSAILAMSSLYLLRGANLVMSILGDMVQAGNNPPQNTLQGIRLGIELARKVINAVTVSYNGMLTFIQYLSCQQASEIT